MKCSSGKIQYDNDRQALAYAAAYNIGKYAHRQRTMREYLCKECRYWHVSTVSRVKRTRKRKETRRRSRAHAVLALSVWEGEGGA